MTPVTPESDFLVNRWSPRMKLPVDAATYSDIQQFLHREALLLDNACYDEWCELLTLQIHYIIHTRNGARCDSLLPFSGADMEYSVIRQRLAAMTARPTDPGASGRIRRIIMNVSASFCERRNDFEVTSYLLLTRADETMIDQPVLSAERHDYLRRTNRGFVILRREIIVDAARGGHIHPSTLI
jgi:3-phenylpropionate/cinnamic acid dioxygenase small subunit